MLGEGGEVPVEQRALVLAPDGGVERRAPRSRRRHAGGCPDGSPASRGARGGRRRRTSCPGAGRRGGSCADPGRAPRPPTGTPPGSLDRRAPTRSGCASPSRRAKRPMIAAEQRQEPVGAVGSHPPEPARRTRRSVEVRIPQCAPCSRAKVSSPRSPDPRRARRRARGTCSPAREVLEHQDEPLRPGVEVEPVHGRDLDVERRSDVAVEADLVATQVGEVAEQPDRGGRRRHLDEHRLGHAVTPQPQSHPVGGALGALHHLDLGDPTTEQRSEAGRIEIVHRGGEADRRVARS